jgi:hypothetical protein
MCGVDCVWIQDGIRWYHYCLYIDYRVNKMMMFGTIELVGTKNDKVLVAVMKELLSLSGLRE